MFQERMPDDREGRWRLLDEVIRQWFPPAVEPAGVDRADLDDAERRLGLRLPAALREWHERWGWRHRVWCVQDAFLRPAELFVDGGTLVICREAQDVVWWGLGQEDLGLEDPSIRLLDRTTRAAWAIESDRTSSFAFQLAAMNAKFTSMRSWRANGQATPGACAAIERCLSRLPLPGLRWPVAPTRFYGHDELVVECDADDWLWVTARTREAFDQVQAIADETGVVWEPSDAA